MAGLKITARNSLAKLRLFVSGEKDCVLLQAQSPF
jgi:hypothetical protein